MARTNVNSAEKAAPAPPIPAALRPGNLALKKLQEALNGLFGPRFNPLYLLGSITFFLFGILVVTGVYLYFFYDMSPQGAYDSVERITEGQKYYGGVIRSVHRYASDGMMLTIFVHIMQVFFSDRFRGSRWFAWVTGSLTLPVFWFIGVTGYFLVWDERGQMIALEAARLLDLFSFSAEPVSRNFLFASSLSSTLFFVASFLHITLPALSAIIIWVHTMRVTRPQMIPPWKIALPVTGYLLALSLIVPATSMGKADLTRLYGTVDIDWYYLFVFPFVDATGLYQPYAWGLAAILFLLFMGMPWLIRGKGAVKKKTGTSG